MNLELKSNPWPVLNGKKNNFSELLAIKRLSTYAMTSSGLDMINPKLVLKGAKKANLCLNPLGCINFSYKNLK